MTRIEFIRKLISEKRDYAIVHGLDTIDPALLTGDEQSQLIDRLLNAGGNRRMIQRIYKLTSQTSAKSWTDRMAEIGATPQ